MTTTTTGSHIAIHPGTSSIPPLRLSVGDFVPAGVTVDNSWMIDVSTASTAADGSLQRRAYQMNQNPDSRGSSRPDIS